MKEKILAVIAANKARQNRARELNTRAGESLFKVYSGVELVSFVANCLNGARRQIEIAQPDKLLLPELDSAEVARVERENPLEITILGRKVDVSYNNHNNGAPTVKIDFRGEQAKDWLRLPVEGILLPGGREVKLYSAIDGHGYYIEAMSSVFPATARECLNSGKWADFERSAQKPEISLPDPSAENSAVPAMREHQYGACAVSNEPLFAFGTVAVKSYHYYSSDPWFEGKWFQKRDEAETVRNKAIEKFAELRKEAAERKLMEVARAEAQAAKEHAKDVHGVYRSLGKNRGTEMIYERAYGYLPNGLEELRRWTAETNALTEKALAEIAVNKAAAEIEKARAEETARKKAGELAPLVEKIGSDRAEFARDLAEELMTSIGAYNAHRRLSAEFTADYGRMRRQSALVDICQGEKGRQFQAFHQARVVDSALEGAIFWLEHKYGVRPVAQPVQQHEPSTKLDAGQPPLNLKSVLSQKLGQNLGIEFGNIFDKLKF